MCVYIYIKADKYSKIIIIIIIVVVVVGTQGLRKKLKDRNVDLRTKRKLNGRSNDVKML